MKKLILISLVIMFCFTAQAKVWRVNNITGLNADYTNFIAAQANASANDTLYFEGSTVSYGNIVLTKPLTIIGTGYFLNENPQTQFNLTTAKFGTIGFNTGSSSSVLTGIVADGTTTINVSNISIIRCKTVGIVVNSSSISLNNILILGNYISYWGISSDGSNPVNNIIISNNYVGYTIDSIVLGSNVSGFIYNNILVYDVNTSNFTFSNNIQKGGSLKQNNNVFHNNIGNGTQFPVGNGNQQNVNMTNVFIGATGNSTDGQWQLKEYSPALRAGNDGTDCGMFGGTTPYVLSGLPSIPAIYEIIMPATGDNLNGIDVTIKAKTH